MSAQGSNGRKTQYCDPFAESEKGLLGKRHSVFKNRKDPSASTQVPARELSGQAVGFALSGGGIRSATFCLGVFQALARRHLLHAVDYLSTVSGGGYFGSFWTGWLSRGTGRAHFEKAETALADCTSPEVSWLRENGRYLAPNGTMDAFTALAAHLRNLVAIHVSLIAYWLAVFGFLNALLLSGGPGVGWHVPAPASHPLVVLPVISGLWAAALVVIALGVIVGTAYFWAPDGEEGATRRNRCTRHLTRLMVTLVAILALASVDVVARLLYDYEGDFKALSALIGASAVAAAGRTLWPWIEPLRAKAKKSLSLSTLAVVAAVVLAAAWLIGLDWLALFLAQKLQAGFGIWFGWQTPLGCASCALALFALLVALICSWDEELAFLNFSSHATLYAARLTRTFHGASNPDRHNGSDPVTRVLPGDIIPYADFDPTAAGGPIHLINVTINETLDARSQTEQRDRHGLPLAVGPAGLSVGVRHHAGWVDRSRRAKVRSESPPSEFGVWGPHGEESSPEPRTLGEWIGISGAAFTTGLGGQTSRATSFLLGFSNIRLGYWWNSNVRRIPGKRTLLAWLRALHIKLLPVQSGLLNEFLARFRGPHAPAWYLSDGGHFENTAAYELIRRRLPFIVACDCGCDPQGTFQDLGNLIRKARIDFQTEIEICDKTTLDTYITDPRLRSLFASLEGFEAGGGTDVGDTDAGRHAPGHAILARMHYPEGDIGFMLILKPSLTGDEPVDVLHYDRERPRFPQESTSDQFFDEAQWESYRKLGEHIAERVFASADTAKPFWNLIDASA